MDGEIDREMEYEINAIVVGNYVVKAVLNPDRMGRKPYSVDSFERIPGSFWGKGVPEMMADVQDVCNAVARSIVNNASLDPVPRSKLTYRCSDSEEIWPWKIWQSNNQQMSEQPAVKFNQPIIVVLLVSFHNGGGPTGFRGAGPGNTGGAGAASGCRC